MCLPLFDTISYRRYPHIFCSITLTSQEKEVPWTLSMIRGSQLQSLLSHHKTHWTSQSLSNKYWLFSLPYCLSPPFPPPMSKVFLDVYAANGTCAVQHISPSVFSPLPTTSCCPTTKNCTAKEKHFGQALMLFIPWGCFTKFSSQYWNIKPEGRDSLISFLPLKNQII